MEEGVAARVLTVGERGQRVREWASVRLRDTERKKTYPGTARRHHTGILTGVRTL